MFETLNAWLADLRPLSLKNHFHWVEPGIISRSRQPTASDLSKLLRANGIRAVINLRGANLHKEWYRSEIAVCAELGVAHIDAKMDSRQLPTRDMVVTLLEAFETAARPFLVKCRGGSDRTGFASALYFLHVNGHRLKGWEHLSPRYLHYPARNQEWMKEFLEYAEEGMAEKALLEWVRMSYVPEAFAKWLDNKGEGDSYDRIFRE